MKTTKREAIALGASEFITRTAPPWKDGRPTQWQALVRHTDARKSWGVGVSDDPEKAEQLALDAFVLLHSRNTEEQQPRVRVRARPRQRVRTRNI